MSQLPLKNMDGKTVGEFKLADEFLAMEKGDQAVHDAVVAYQANLRAGSAHTLGKGAVAGSNKKPWKQKGTGRARAGNIRSPVWRGGGVAHGPHPRDFGWDLPKRSARLAFRRAFSVRVSEGAVSVVDEIALAEPRTKLMAEAVKKLGSNGKLLIVVDRVNEALARASRNLPKVEVTAAKDVNTYSLLRWPSVVVTRAGMAEIQKRLAAGRKSE